MRTRNGYVRSSDGKILMCVGVTHGPTEPCGCGGCAHCNGYVTGCTCDIDWSCLYNDDHSPECWQPALPGSSGNWPAVIAAVHARGPRCAGCDLWTFRPALWTGRTPYLGLLCRSCEQADDIASQFPMDPPAYARTENGS